MLAAKAASGGQRHIHGGRPALHRVLQMTAVAAIMHASGPVKPSNPSPFLQPVAVLQNL